MIITHAAIMYSNGGVIEGHDYGTIESIGDRLCYSGDKTYGFLTSFDDFVLPNRAAIIAFRAEQITELTDSLSPEDIWSSAKDERAY